MTLAMHSKASVEWYTPSFIVEGAREVLRGIDLDPASCELANKTVRAERFHSQYGQSRPWSGRVFCNPPGGQVGEFWAALACHAELRAIQGAVWVGFSLEQLATLQRFPRSPMHFPTCVLRKRVRYIDANGVPSKRPTHSSYVTYVPGSDLDRSEDFRAVFSEWGVVS